MDLLSILFQIVGWVCVSVCFLGALLLVAGRIRKRFRGESDDENGKVYFMTCPLTEAYLFETDPDGTEEENATVEAEKKRLVDAGYAGVRVLIEGSDLIWIVAVGPLGDWLAAAVAKVDQPAPAVRWRLGEEYGILPKGVTYRMQADLGEGKRFLATTEPKIASSWPPNWEIHHLDGLDLAEFIAQARARLAGRRVEDRSTSTFEETYSEDYRLLVDWQARNGEPSLNALRGFLREIGVNSTAKLEQELLTQAKHAYETVIEESFHRRFLDESGISAAKWRDIGQFVVFALDRPGAHGDSNYYFAKEKIAAHPSRYEILHEFSEPILALVVVDRDGSLLEA